MPPTVRSALTEADIVAAANHAGIDLKAAADLPEFAQMLAFARAAHFLGTRRGRKNALEDAARKIKVLMDDAIENAS
jgi:hypothetical protein